MQSTAKAKSKFVRIKQLEAGRSAKGVAREMGVSDQTIYNWKSKYGGMEASEPQAELNWKSLKDLEPPARIELATC